MKIIIAKRDLEVAIQIATLGIAVGNSDLSGHYLFRIRGKQAEVLTYSGRLFAGCPLICQVEGDDGDAFTLDGWRLKQWLGAVGEEVLTLEGGDASAKATSSRGSVTWPSLDPDKFPYWDDILAVATESAEVEVERLHAALAYVKQFVSSEENAMPHLALTEIIQPTDDKGNPDGASALYATDQVGVAVIQIAGMDNSRLRIHGKDTAAVLSFLALKGSDKVKVLEHDRCLFFRRTDEALFGVARPNSQFPGLNVGDDSDEKVWWTVDVAEMEQCIRFLTTAAAKDDTRIKFRFDKGEDSVVMSVAASAGGEISLPVKTIDYGGIEDLPDTGFMVRHPYLTKVTSQFASDTLRFGIFEKKKGGWVRFQHEKDGDKYLTVVVWVR